MERKLRLIFLTLLGLGIIGLVVCISELCVEIQGYETFLKSSSSDTINYKLLRACNLLDHQMVILGMFALGWVAVYCKQEKKGEEV